MTDREEQRASVIATMLNEYESELWTMDVIDPFDGTALNQLVEEFIASLVRGREDELNELSDAELGLESNGDEGEDE